MSPSCHSDVSITRIKQDLSGDWPISLLVTLTWIGPYGGISSPHQLPIMMMLLILALVIPLPPGWPPAHPSAPLESSPALLAKKEKPRKGQAF